MQTIQYTDFIKRYDVNFRAKPNDEDFVGAGGFGYVYKGYDKLKHTPVAIKRSATNKNLLDEVEKAKQLPQHVNIARYLEGFRIETEADDFDVAILQYYPKGNLNQLIASGELNNDQIHDLVLGILEGIGFLHKGFTDSNGKHRSIIHRDLKPQNILIAEYKGAYTPLITDFGISKLVKAEDIHSTGGIELSNQMGTMMYKAPEQVLGGTVRSNLDLWAFGIILFKMLTGKLPFGADTQMSTESVLNKITKSDLEEIFIQLKNYPEVYQQIIRKCLVRDIKTRVQTADELIEMLKVASKVVEEKNHKVVNHQTLEEKTDDKNDLKENAFEITEPLKPISKVIKENRFEVSREISEDELAKWNQPDAQHSLRVGSFHRGNVVSSTSKNDLTIRLEYGVCVKIEDYFERTHIPFDLGDYLESRITSCDFKNHKIELGVLKKIDHNESIDNQGTDNGIGKGGIIVIISFLLLIFSSVFWFKNDNKTIEETSFLDSATVAQVDTVGPGVIQLPDGNNFHAEIDSFEDKIVKFISDDSQPVNKKIWFDTDRIIFASGSPNPHERSIDQIENIAYILKAFPNVKIKIGCYSDNVGNPEANIKLTTDRAIEVARQICARGIDTERLSAEGYGDQNPIASNDTEEGRATNRRLAISVRAK